MPEQLEPEEQAMQTFCDFAPSKVHDTDNNKCKSSKVCSTYIFNKLLVHISRQLAYDNI